MKRKVIDYWGKDFRINVIDEMKSNKKLKAKEMYEFGIWLTIFENEDVYVSTKGDVHIIEDLC